MSFGRVGLVLAVLLTVAAVGLVRTAPRGQAQGDSPLYGFTGFPYELSAESLDVVGELIAPASNLYAIHLDGPCIPWTEASTGEPFPEWLTSDWDETVERIPVGHTVYVAITPTQVDRLSLQAPCGVSENEPGTMPAALEGKGFSDPAVVAAYIAYAERVIGQFEPAFVNLAIEITEMSLASPETWEEFEPLYLETLESLRVSYPETQFGLEVVLQSLMVERVGEQMRPAIEASDYMGISFYPYGGEYGEAVGAYPLPAPPDQWLEPLAFARAYTDLPLAICETGYTTVDITLPVNPDFDLHFNGDEELQTAFTRDLVDITTADGYLFVVWFVPVDYPVLLEQMGAGEGDPGRIWMHAGLWADPETPKPALAEWLRFAEW
jgi:hypothetical protein